MKDNTCREGNSVLALVKVLGLVFRPLELHLFVGNRYPTPAIKSPLSYDRGDELSKTHIFIGTLQVQEGMGAGPSKRGPRCYSRQIEYFIRI